MQPQKTNSGQLSQLERSTGEKLSEKYDDSMKQVNKENDINPIKMYEGNYNKLAVKSAKLVDKVA